MKLPTNDRVQQGIFIDKVGIQQGVYATAIEPEVKEFLIAVDDIGAVAAFAFDHPETLIGQRLELAGDALTPAQTAKAISAATGFPVQAEHIPLADFMRQNPGYGQVIDFFNRHGFDVDIPALRVLHPGLLDFETWLAKTGKAKFAELFRTHARVLEGTAQ